MRNSPDTRQQLHTQLHLLVEKLVRLPNPKPSATPHPRTKKRKAAFAQTIDHTLLKPEATLDQVLAACLEARTQGFASVCVHSHWLPEVTRALRGSTTRPIAVVGFPQGSMLPGAKAAETRLAVRAGAREIDMVINLGRLKSRDWKFVFEDIRGVVQAAGKAPVKVILETALLTQEEKAIGAVLSELAGAAFVKTCTGYGGGGATVDDIQLLRQVVSKQVKIKASGGIKTRAAADALIEAGADRLGTSSGVALVTSETPASKSLENGASY